jgi:hypothetical protein
MHELNYFFDVGLRCKICEILNDLKVNLPTYYNKGLGSNQIHKYEIFRTKQFRMSIHGTFPHINKNASLYPRMKQSPLPIDGNFICDLEECIHYTVQCLLCRVR